MKDLEVLDWTLLPDEIDFVRRIARGTENVIKYALHICHLRLTGRFVIYRTISLRICNYLAKQLHTEFLHNSLAEGHPGTESRIRQQVYEFLGFKPFNDTAYCKIEEWFSCNSNSIADKQQLSLNIEKFLVQEKFILPAVNQLMRKVFNIYNKKQLDTFKTIALNLTDLQKKFIEKLCKEDDTYNLLAEIKKPLGDPNVKNILVKIELLNKIKPLHFERLNLSLLDPSYVTKLSELVERYDRSAIRKIRPEDKKYTMLVCHLCEVVRTAIDHILDANDKLVGEIERRINRDYEHYYNQFSNNVKLSRNLALEVLKKMKTHELRDILTIKQFCDEFGNEKFDKIINDYEQFENFDYSGKAELARRRYSYLHEYIEKFLSLDFKATPGTERLLDQVKTLVKNRKLKQVPETLGIDFIESPWKQGLYDKKVGFNYKSWELGLFFAVRKALGSSRLYIPQSKNHREFWAPLYEKTAWMANRSATYEELGLPKSAKLIIKSLKKEFTEHFNKAKASFGPGSFAEFKNGKLKIHTDEPLIISESLSELQNLTSSHFETIRIEKLLIEIQKITNYQKEFKPVEGYDQKIPLQLPILNAAITGHATNLGLYGISQSTKGITIDKLRHLSNWYITAGNLKAASELLINAQQNYWITHILGKGERSGSDCQRFVINKKSVLGSMYPRDFGALVRSIGIYTHMSDQYSVFNTEVISCSIREAIYVLEGFIDNQSMVQCNIHSTDTHGFTEIVFALMYLFGISFQPHFKDLKDQQLYSFNRKDAEEYMSLFSQEKVSEELLEEQWDDICRLIYSLKKKLIKPHVIIQKLHNQQSSTKLAKALTHLGRIVKTIYILRYLHDKDMRRGVRLQLNRVESRHSLVRNIFFAAQGAFKTNDPIELMNKASCLSFISNAIVLYNTIQLQKTYEILKSKGYLLKEEDMARISPLSSKHIIMHGVYNFYE